MTSDRCRTSRTGQPCRVAGLLATCVVLAAAGAGPAHASFGLLGSLGTVGASPGEVFRAGGTAFAPGGNLMYVADTANNRVQRWSVPGGAPDQGWGVGGVVSTRGPANTPLVQPTDVAVDSVGNLYVIEGTSPTNPSIGDSWLLHKYDPSGAWLTTWGSEGGASARFTFPAGVATHSDTKGTPETTDDVTVVYVGEGRNQMQERVQKFSATGVFERTWGWGVKTGADAFEVCLPADLPCRDGQSSIGDGGFRRLMGIATDASGFVWTVDGDNRRVQKFTPDGQYVSKFAVDDDAGQTPPEFPGIDVSPTTGLVWVLTRPGGLRAFTQAGALETALTQRCPVNVWGLGVLARPPAPDEIYVGSDEKVLRFADAVGARPCNEALAPPPPPPPPPPTPGLTFGGREGVTIKAGQLFTDDPVVPLTIVAPGGTLKVLISNDGGFRDPTGPSICGTDAQGTCLADPALDGVYNWKLLSGGSERLPKTVYVRFASLSGTSVQTFTDDIILDMTNPMISQATVSPGGAGAAAAAARVRRRRFTVRVRATDNASGVGRMQLAVVRRRPAKPRAFRRRLVIRATRPPVYVRVQDRAGNLSRWRKLAKAR